MIIEFSDTKYLDLTRKYFCRNQIIRMPIHSWNWFRAVGVGNDLKSWYGDNPQVEDGREGGNQEFDDDVSGQYEDEVNFMMRRLRLNFYRAEDMMLIYMKKKWAVRLRISPSLWQVLSVDC